MELENLEELRKDMKIITKEILDLINQRMAIAKKIGEIKSHYNIDVIDDKVEQDIKNYLFQNPSFQNFDPEFLGRIVNLLIIESIKIQNLVKRDQIIQKNSHSSVNVESQDTYEPKNNFRIRTHIDVFNYAKYLSSLGKKVIHMEVGEPDFSPPNEVDQELKKIYSQHKYHYTETQGIRELRSKLSENLSILLEKNNKQNIKTNADNILVTPGGRFAIFSTFCSILHQGDEIIVIEPAWPACMDCANFMSVKTKIIKTNFDSNWEPDLTEIEDNITPNTKIICLNYPNNPTGKIISQKKLNSIIDIAQKNGSYILSDEVYMNYSYKDISSSLFYPYDKSIIIGSFSKTYSMTGFRVGYAYCTSEETIKSISKIQSLSLTSVAEPMQYCALSALNSDPHHYSTIMEKRIKFVCSKLENMPFKFNYPDGALYIFAKIDNSLRISDLTLITKLLENGLAVAPGSGFGLSYSNFIRISATQEMNQLEEGLEILNKVVSNL